MRRVREDILPIERHTALEVTDYNAGRPEGLHKSRVITEVAFILSLKLSRKTSLEIELRRERGQRLQLRTDGYISVVT
jgi:hypothetical protein